MAWDFCNDPAFEPELEWTRRLVREEIEPLDVVKPQMSRANYKLAAAPLKQAVKDRGLWAGHLDKELGGQGMGQVKLALLHEILGRTPSAPEIFGNQAPDSGNGELSGHRRQRRAEGPVAVAAPGRRVDLILLAHRAAFGRVGPDADHHLGPVGRR